MKDHEFINTDGKNNIRDWVNVLFSALLEDHFQQNYAEEYIELKVSFPAGKVSLHDVGSTNQLASCVGPQGTLLTFGKFTKMLKCISAKGNPDSELLYFIKQTVKLKLTEV